MRSLALVLVFAAACSPPLDAAEASSLRQAQLNGDTGGGAPGPTSCRTVNLKGSAFYNDLRTYGRFADRRTLLFNTPGVADPYDTSPDKVNYLGLFEGTVEVYEVDDLSMVPGSTAGCASTEWMGSTEIQADGSWSFSGQVCDACRDLEGPNEELVNVAARIVLSNCFDSTKRCFSVAQPEAVPPAEHYDDQWGGTEWARWCGTAGVSNPLRLGSATVRDLGIDFFQETNAIVAGDPDDLYAQAASVFASLSDVTRQTHEVYGVPYDFARWGKVTAYWPSTLGAGHSHQGGSDRMCVGLGVDDLWVNGKTPAHEYGHLVNYWQWDGVGKWSDYCFDSDGDSHVDQLDASGAVDLDGDGDLVDECAESLAQREYATNTLKEGWAQFFFRMTFTDGGVGGCEVIEKNVPRADTFTDFTGALVCKSGQTCKQGRHFYDDVAQVLCDLWDTPADTKDGATDRLALTLPQLVDGLGELFASSSASQQAVMQNATWEAPVTTSAFSICSLSEALAGPSVPGMAVAETLAVSHLDCGGSWLSSTSTAPHYGP